MSTKYPPFERVTAGKLAKGDRLLVRERLADRSVRGWKAALLPTGSYTIRWVGSELRDNGGRKLSRIYTIDLLHDDGTEQTVVTSSVQRFNRITGDAS